MKNIIGDLLAWMFVFLAATVLIVGAIAIKMLVIALSTLAIALPLLFVYWLSTFVL